jgi:uncharacterized protein YdhG (YjbR/CyaY superfamily)
MMTSAKASIQTIDQYIDTFSPDVQTILENLRLEISKAVPDAEETISYQIPTFRLKGKNLVHFAAYKQHIGFYPTPSGISAFKSELNPYELAKGSVKFPLNKPLPLALIIRIVKFRVNEILENEK